MLDATDLRIVALLQANARTSNADIARDLGMAPSAVHERIKKLEQRGVLLGYEARIDPAAVGLGLLAFVLVRAEEGPMSSAAGEALARLPEVQEVHHVAGEDCYLVKLRARDTSDLARILRESIATLPAIRGTRTTIVLASLRESARLPLAGNAEVGP